MNNNFDNEKKENMPIRTFVNKRLIGVYEDSTVQESAQKMVEFGISSLVVIDKGEVIGFFTDGDLKKKIVAEGRSPQTEVNKIMKTELVTIDIDKEFKDALKLMIDKHIKHILVEENGKIVGVLTFTDFLDIQRLKVETFISRE